MATLASKCVGKWGAAAQGVGMVDLGSWRWGVLRSPGGSPWSVGLLGLEVGSSCLGRGVLEVGLGQFGRGSCRSWLLSQNGSSHV